MFQENEGLKKVIYQEALNYLASKINNDKKIIEKYLLPDEKRKNPQSLNEIYKAILGSAQNASMSPNVIGKSISGEKGNIDPLGRILFEFSPKETYRNFSEKTETDLYNLIKPSLRKTPNPVKITLWLRFCKTIISSAKFLTQFESSDAFYRFIDSYYQNDQMRYFLPILLSFEIDGFGFALACDFLKEIGYVKYGKPDTHIKDIFLELNLLPKIPKNSLKANYLSLKLFENIAMLNNTIPYSVDKVLWLICSGNFYYHKEIGKIGGSKKEFIDYMRKLGKS